MEQVGVEPKWASLIADWIDPDSQPLPDGAEDSLYATQDPPYRAPNTFITTPAELLALPGFGRERYQKLAPFVTALPRDASINICSASGLLLDALVGPTDKSYGATDPETFAKSRENGCFPTLEAYKQSFSGGRLHKVLGTAKNDHRTFGDANDEQYHHEQDVARFIELGGVKWAMPWALQNMPGLKR